jgi:hypothetical protein
VIPYEPEEDKIYLKSLVLVRHLRIEAWKSWWTRVWIWAKAPTIWRRKERVLNRFSLGTLSIYGQFRNKITFYPVIEGAYVNTKNWYREETDLWAEFGRRAPFGKRFSSKHSVKVSAVGSTSSFGRRAVSRLERGSIQECVMTWLEYKERMNWWWVWDGHDAIRQ